MRVPRSTTSGPDRRRAVVFAAAALAMTAALAGCGSSKSPAAKNQSSTPGGRAPTTVSAGSSTAGGSAGPTAAACQYISVAKVSAAVGAPVTATPTPPGPPFNAPGCLYASSGAPRRQIDVQVLTAKQIANVPGLTAKSYFKQAKAGLADVKSISGFGDEAFTAGSAGSTIQARKGTTIVIVNAGVGGVSAQAVAATRTVMKAVLAHV